MIMWVGQNVTASNVNVNWRDESYVRWGDVNNWISAQMFDQLTLEQIAYLPLVLGCDC